MSQVVVNLGTAGTSLNGTLGSSSSADSNDPKFLKHPGDNGGNYIYLVNQNPSNLSLVYETAFNITGDLDLRAYVALDDWTPSATNTLISRYDNNIFADRHYEFNITTAGLLSLIIYTTTTLTRNSTVAPTISNGQDLWVRATLDVDNGSAGHSVKFFTSPNGVTWTQLGNTVTNAGVIAIQSGTIEPVTLGKRSSGATGFVVGKYYRAIIYSDLTETNKVLDVDTSVVTGSSATFTAVTGQTVSINRATTGMKPVRVVSSIWLFGTDDYIEVADNALLDFSNSESFSLVAIYRQWTTFGTNDTLIAKKANTTNTTQGYYLGAGATTATQTQGQVGDGTNGATATQTTVRTSGVVYVSTLVRDVAADTITTYLNNSAGTPVTDTTTLTSANSEAFRIGRLSGAGTEYSDIELVAVAVFRKALTATEISQIVSYYGARLS